jgi:hypothetical protein
MCYNMIFGWKTPSSSTKWQCHYASLMDASQVTHELTWHEATSLTLITILFCLEYAHKTFQGLAITSCCKTHELTPGLGWDLCLSSVGAASSPEWVGQRADCERMWKWKNRENAHIYWVGESEQVGTDNEPLKAVQWMKEDFVFEWRLPSNGYFEGTFEERYLMIPMGVLDAKNRFEISISWKTKMQVRGWVIS